jgi:hypothetical protein
VLKGTPVVFKGTPVVFKGTPLVFKGTPVVFISDHLHNINTTENQVNTTGVLSNTAVSAVRLDKMTLLSERFCEHFGVSVLGFSKPLSLSASLPSIQQTTVLFTLRTPRTTERFQAKDLGFQFSKALSCKKMTSL